MIVIPEEWIHEPDAEGNGLLRAMVVSGNLEFPIPIETYNVALDDVTTDAEQNFELILECEQPPRMFSDEESFRNALKHGSMAPESVIPAGLFPVKEEKDFVPTAQIILNGKVVKTYPDPTEFGFGENDLLFALSCLGNEYDAVLYSDLAEDEIVLEEGNIVSGVYWVQGWPSREEG